MAQKMIGIRARVAKRTTVGMALSQEKYLVSAGCSWSHQNGARKAKLQLFGTGIDDREDNVEWFSITNPVGQRFIDAEVVDIASPDWPRRKTRPTVDWRAHFRDKRKKDRLTVNDLNSQIEKLDDQSRSELNVNVPCRPSVGFRVSLNGRVLGTVGVGDPGSLSISIYVKHGIEGDVANLHIHGGDLLGEDAWRWRKWKWESRKLLRGERVRIDVVGPRDVDIGEVKEVVSYRPRTREDLREALEELRTSLKDNMYAQRAVEMMARDRERLAPRRYPRFPIKK